MEDLLNSIMEIFKSILYSDPAVYRVIITDKQGLEIAQYTKHWDRRPYELRKKGSTINPIYPLLNAICNNAEKFLNFLRYDKKSPFIFTWNFERTIIFAASSPYGFMGVFCETDVNEGLMRILLREKMKEYIQLVSGVFQE
ncbi:MAG: hypothetical protein ACTSU2_16310 [Promethearchaeota archaeon]